MSASANVGGTGGLDDAKDELLGRAARACTHTPGVRQDAGEILEYLRSYYRHVAPEDLLDRDPVDVTDDDQVRWLLAGVWPDTGRLPRTRQAIDEARRAQLRLIPGDALASVGGAVAAIPAGVVPVVVTTWALAYLAPPDRLAFREALATASRDRPVAWVSGEGRGVVDLFADVETPPDGSGNEANHLGLVVFRDGRCADAEVLAFVHPHGSWIHWRG